MATYSDYQQRLLDQKSGEEMDRHKATSVYLNRYRRSEAEVRFGTPDDFAAYLSDFFVSWSTAVKEENEAAELFDSEREFVSRSNHMRRS